MNVLPKFQSDSSKNEAVFLVHAKNTKKLLRHALKTRSSTLQTPWSQYDYNFTPIGLQEIRLQSLEWFLSPSLGVQNDSKLESKVLKIFEKNLD